MVKRAGIVLAGMMWAAAFARGGAPDDAGKAAIADLNWKQAIRVYTPLAEAAKPGTPEWTTATFCLAVAKQQVQPADSSTIGEATTLYQSIVDTSKDSRYVARSLMNLGRIAELQDYSADTADLAKARTYYEQVIAQFPGEPIASEAALREGSAFIMEYDLWDYKKVRQGTAFLEKWLADHPNDPLASLMWQTAGDGYFMPLDDWKNALRCYETVDKLGWTDQGNQGAWYWRAAQIAESFKDTQTAVKYYTKIIKETPNSGKGYASVLALHRLGAPVPENPLFDDPANSPTTQTAAMSLQGSRQ